VKFRSRIASRIFAFNALLVFLPVAAFSLLGSYERSLVDSLEQALAQQARLLAAWLGEDARAAATAAGARLEGRAAQRALSAIGDRRTARFRVVDSGGRLLADSSGMAAAAAPAAGRLDAGSSREAAAVGAEADAPAGEPLLYRLFSAPDRLWRRFLAPPAPPLASADFYAAAGTLLLGSEVRAALDGRYGAATRVSSGGQVSVTLYSAVPVAAGGRVLGAVLVSQSTWRILRDLYAIRLDIAKIFLGSLAAAAALSLLLALTIVVPLRRLGDAAAASLGSASAFPESGRSDEIGDLQRSLRSLALRLDERMLMTERFAADAAHEFRNPLAAIRSAAELAEGAVEASDRSRFHRAIIDDAERLRAIVDGLRRLSLAEGAPERALRTPVDLAQAARAACARAAARCAHEFVDKRVAFRVESDSPGPEAEIDPAALDLILDNLALNAASFAKSEVRVSVAAGAVPKGRATAARRDLEIAVEDDGPGILPEHLGRVFDRFFTWRPGEVRGLHTGLGLSLALVLARSQGGDIAAANREDGPGARFALRLPGPPL
jgi:two-component system, OmpR family, sensor histidine kinase ChvG